MNEQQQNHILAIWSQKSDGTISPKASLNSIAEFEETHKSIPSEFKWFLLNCGGGTVGPEWVEGIDELFCIHQKYHEECNIPNGYSYPNFFIIGWDGSGSPILIDNEGKVVAEHPGEPLATLANSFAEWVISSHVEHGG